LPAGRFGREDLLRAEADRRRLAETEIDELVRRAFGADVTGVEELTGGTFSSVYAVGLADGRRLGVDIGAPADRIAASVQRHAAVLNEVEQPVLVHFDLWDGNVLVRPRTWG
jgi:hypothetical protein